MSTLEHNESDHSNSEGQNDLHAEAEIMAGEAVRELYQNLGDRNGLNPGDESTLEVHLFNFDPEGHYTEKQREYKLIETALTQFYRELGLSERRYLDNPTSETKGTRREPAITTYKIRDRVRVRDAPIEGTEFEITEIRVGGKAFSPPSIHVSSHRIRLTAGI